MPKSVHLFPCTLKQTAMTSKQSTTAIQAAKFPVHECLVSKNLFEVGTGLATMSRTLAKNTIAISFFELDVFAEGVVNTFYKTMTLDEYHRFLTERGADTESVHPACVRKLVEGAVKFSEKQGFSNPKNYIQTSRIFGEFDAAACPVRYTFGKDGMPTRLPPAKKHLVDEALRIANGIPNNPLPTDLERDAPSASELRTVTYRITNEPIGESAFDAMPKAVIDECSVLYESLMANRNVKRIIVRLQQLSADYPDVCQFYNWLYVGYTYTQNTEKALSILHATIEKFPDYLFGKISLARHYLDNGEPDRVPEVFGNKLELKFLYPDRDVFHVTEVLNFYYIIARYLIVKDAHSLAQNCLDILKNVDPKSDQARHIESLLHPTVPESMKDLLLTIKKSLRRSKR